MSQRAGNWGAFMIAKKYLLASTICLAPLAAHAASPVFNWTGFYVGASVGIAGQNTHMDDTVNGIFQFPVDFRNSGFIGGGNVGYNWQVAPNWVLGLETDISGISIDETTNLFGTVNFSSRLDALGTVRARAGYAFDRVLLYATGGLAYGHVKNAGLAPADPTFGGTSDKWQSGWTAGGGVEYAFLPNWTVRVEGLYVDLGSSNVDFSVGANSCRFAFRNRYKIGRLGVNYKF